MKSMTVREILERIFTNVEYEYCIEIIFPKDPDGKFTPVAFGQDEIGELLNSGDYEESEIFYLYSRSMFSQLWVAYFTFFFDVLLMCALIATGFLLFMSVLVQSLLYFRQEQEMLQQQHDMLKHQRDLLISIAHELKTPMGTARLYAEKIGRGNSLEQVQQDSSSLQREVTRMRDRLDMLLTYSRMKDVPNLNKSEFAFSSLLEDVADQYYPQMEEKEISFDLATQQGIKVYADSARISMAVSNFLSNAIKFTPENGEIKLTQEEAANGCVRVSVHNSGSHIPQEDTERIWNYLDMSGNTDDSRVGTGLGLPIVRRIIDLHGGRCGAENMENGMVFWFEVPVGMKK